MAMMGCLVSKTCKKKSASTHSHYSKHSVAGSRQSIACSSLGCREELGSEPVEDGIHDVTEEAKGTVPTQ